MHVVGQNEIPLSLNPSYSWSWIIRASENQTTFWLHFNLNFILTYNMYTVEQLHRSDICSLIFMKATAQIKILAVLWIFNSIYQQQQTCKLLIIANNYALMANTIQRFLAWCLLKIISQQYSEMWKVLFLSKRCFGSRKRVNKK